MKRIMALFLSLLMVVSLMTVILTSTVSAAASQTVTIPLGIPGSGSEKFIVSSSAPLVTGVRWNDCFRLTILKFVFPSDTTTATAVASINNANSEVRATKANAGAFAFAASTDMVNWTDVKIASSENVLALKAEEKGNIDVSMDLTAFLKTDKIVFVKAYDKTILGQGGLDPSRGTILRGFNVTYNSTKPLNENKNFDGWEIEASRWVEEYGALALSNDVPQLVSKGDFVRHGTDMGSPYAGYSSATFLGVVPTVYKFKLNPGTKKAALSIELQYAYRLDVSADKKTWTKMLSSPYVTGSETPEDPLNVKHHNLALPESAIAADGTVYVRISEGTAWHMSIGIAATENVKASTVTPVPTTPTQSTSTSTSTIKQSETTSSTSLVSTSNVSDEASSMGTESKDLKSSSSVSTLSTSDTSSTDETTNTGLPMPLIVGIIVVAVLGIAGGAFFLLRKKK